MTYNLKRREHIVYIYTLPHTRKNLCNVITTTHSHNDAKIRKIQLYISRDYTYLHTGVGNKWIKEERKTYILYRVYINR